MTSAQELTTDLATRINAEHDEVRRCVGLGLQHALEAGRLLIEAKAKAKVGHGAWLDWLKENCNTISERTVQAYMRVAREVPNLDPAKAQRVADMSFRHALSSLAIASAIDETQQRHDTTSNARRELIADGCFDPAAGICPISGHATIGTAGPLTIALHPSDLPDFFFAIVIIGSDDDESAEVIGTVKPIRRDGISAFLKINELRIEDLHWRSIGWRGPIDRNFFLDPVTP